MLVVTRAFGEAAERAEMPALVGELVAGIMLGFLLQQFQHLTPSIWFAANSEIFDGLAELGMFFLMLLAGIRMEPLDFARSSRSAVLIAIGGMLVPMGIGFAFGQAVLPESDLKYAQALFIGVALAITAVPVAVRIFMDMGALESRVGKTVIAAALWDDLLSLFLMALLVATIGSQAVGSFSVDTLLPVLGKVVLYFAVAIPVGLYLFPLVIRWFRKLSFPEVGFSMTLIAALAYAVLAEYLGLHQIIGAFMAGMFFHPKVVEQQVYERVHQQMSGLTRGFLAPIFFVSVGFHLDVSAVAQAPGFVIALTGLAIISKLVGSGIPAYWAGFSKRGSLLVGVGMSGRGAVELVIAGIAFEAGLFLQPDPPGPIVDSLFSAIVVMAIITTIATPIALRLLWRRRQP
ncbi:MAG: cation:proton antiporter [Woeseiaceae bacterium]|nr:cation:proton antiporter [Woeseiaceae bacterium]